MNHATVLCVYLPMIANVQQGKRSAQADDSMELAKLDSVGTPQIMTRPSDEMREVWIFVG